MQLVLLYEHSRHHHTLLLPRKAQRSFSCQKLQRIQSFWTLFHVKSSKSGRCVYTFLRSILACCRAHSNLPATQCESTTNRGRLMPSTAKSLFRCRPGKVKPAAGSSECSSRHVKASEVQVGVNEPDLLTPELSKVWPSCCYAVAIPTPLSRQVLPLSDRSFWQAGGTDSMLCLSDLDICCSVWR